MLAGLKASNSRLRRFHRCARLGLRHPDLDPAKRELVLEDSPIRSSGHECGEFRILLRSVGKDQIEVVEWLLSSHVSTLTYRMWDIKK